MDIRDAFFDEIYQIGKADKDVVFITDDMDAFGLRAFKRDFPERFINIGVAEQNLVNVAAGLASCGKKVFIYGICSFITTRCLEQIKINLCGMHLPVTIIGVGAGFSFGFDGTTHHGIQDIAIMRALPEMTILNPADACSAVACARLSYQSKNPVYVRLDKGEFPDFYGTKDDFTAGFKILRLLADVNIISTGFMTARAMTVAAELKKFNMNVGVVDLYRVKDIDANFLEEVINHSRAMVTLEENSLVGGMGTAVAEIISDNGKKVSLKRLGVSNKQFLNYGSREWFHSMNKLDLASIIKEVSDFAKKNKSF